MRRNRKAAPSAGYVYVLTNPAMPGLVKIGRTGRDPGKRLKEINSATGVPMPFRIEGAVETRDPAAAEREVHRLLSDRRVNRRREFFRCSPHEAKAAARKAASAVGARYIAAARLGGARRPRLASALSAAAAGAAWIFPVFGPHLTAAWLAACLAATASARPAPLAEFLGMPGSAGTSGYVAAWAAAASAFVVYPELAPTLMRMTSGSL